jgi:hypothetical protein
MDEVIPPGVDWEGFWKDRSAQGEAVMTAVPAR